VTGAWPLPRRPRAGPALPGRSTREGRVIHRRPRTLSYVGKVRSALPYLEQGLARTAN